MNMENYPAGAANDPRAPYNEPPEVEVEVTVRQVLVKETCLLTSETHECVEREYDPCEGRYVYTAFRECDSDLKELYEESGERTALDIIRACEKLCRQLTADGTTFYAGMNINRLLGDCEDWEEEEMEVR